ncbi:MAG: carboxy terminal-processing peptidase [Gammaproteobacteria bacterium]|nr:carboxy terminal-processing peptidase [Gammaproteobacteria bacterium]
MYAKTLLLALVLAAGTGVAMAAAPAATSQGSPTGAPAASTTIAVAPATTLKPQARQVLISRTVVQVMQANHYPSKPLDDQLAKAVLTEYFDAIDPAHFYFTQPAIDRFMQKYAGGLVEDLKQGNLEPAFDIYSYYIDQAHEQLHFALELLNKHYEFDGRESFHFSRRHAPWAANQKALDTLWRHRVTNGLLSLVLDGQSLEKAKETLVKRYRYALNHLNRTTSNDVFDTWMNALAQTQDPHSAYFSPFDAEQFQIHMSLQLEGIGAQLTKHGNYVTVVRILPGGPAAKSKALDAGDRIVAVAQGESGEMVDVIGWRLDDVVKLIRGPKGSTVRLKILPSGALPGGGEQILELVRDTIELDAERASAEIRTIRQGMVAYRIGIITVPSFYVNFQAESNGRKQYTSVSQDVRALIEKLKKKKVSGILLDLRNNGGGSLREALAMTGLFIADGPVVQVKERGDHREVLPTPRDETPVWTGPLAVLVNRFSASATEIFAGAMKDYHRALIIGSRTWGKGTVQQLIKLGRYLPGFRAGELKLTTAQFFRVNGSSTQHRGVKPQIVIPDAINEEKFGESAYPNALPWKHIQAAEYTPVNKGIIDLLPSLRDYYTSTLRKEPQFVIYLQAVKQQQKQSEREEISLNIETRKALREARRARQLDLINAWRRLEGDPTFDDLEAAHQSDFTRPDVPLKTGIQLLARYMGKAPPGAAFTFHLNHRPGGDLAAAKQCLSFMGNPLELHQCNAASAESRGKTLRPPSPASSR